jgi:hypothetical protein
MPKQFLRVTFYGREMPIQLSVGETDAKEFLEAIKNLSAGGKDMQAFYLFPLADKLSALISVHELQTVQFTSKQNGSVWTPKLDHGVAFYMKGRTEPLVLDYSGSGPLDDMFHDLASTGYGEEIPGCIMLADGAGEPSFFRLDEIQYALVRSELIQKPS